jgi:antiviral helicase SKI2
LKEMVEILFSRNLIKVLFATETFAMGVNMPAKAVVFNSIRKHDGTQFRVLEPGEYTQMAGRAGRRGLDKVGTVIMCCFGDQPPPIGLLRNMLTGSSTMLRSQFRLTYNMILNLLRVEEMSVEGMIKRSFSEFATQRALTANDYPKLLARGQKTLAKLEEQFKLESSQRVGAEDLEEYFSTCAQLIAINVELLQFITSAVDGSGDSVLQPGRILLVSAAKKYGVVRMPALVLQTRSSQGTADSVQDSGKGTESLVCMVLLPESYIPENEATAGGKTSSEAKIVSIGSIGSATHRHYAIYEISMDQILLVSALKNKIDPKMLFKEKSTKSTTQSAGHGHTSSAFFGAKPVARGVDDPFAGMKAQGGKKNDDGAFFGKKKSSVSSEPQAIESAVEVLIGAEKDEMSAGLAPLDLRDFLKRGNDVVEFRKRCAVVEGLAELMRQFASHRHPTLEKYYTLVERKYTLQERVEALSHLLSNESLQLFPDFLQRKAVLRTLGYLDEYEAVCVKGRVACEVNTCEELIVTEMVLEGILNELEPTEIVAALSSLLYQQKSDDDDFDMEIPESLLNCCKRMQTIAMNLGQLQKEHGLDIDPIDYCEATLKFGLVHVVYEWALGVPFSNICELTTAQEGSIVRCITRLDELCREVRNCARVVGNPTLYRKMEAASIAIKRDIVFASSLYVS